MGGNSKASLGSNVVFRRKSEIMKKKMWVLVSLSQEGKWYLRIRNSNPFGEEGEARMRKSGKRYFSLS
jgi:hypothetical protein